MNNYETHIWVELTYFQFEHPRKFCKNCGIFEQLYLSLNPDRVYICNNRVYELKNLPSCNEIIMDNVLE